MPPLFVWIIGACICAVIAAALIGIGISVVERMGRRDALIVANAVAVPSVIAALFLTLPEMMYIRSAAFAVSFLDSGIVVALGAGFVATSILIRGTRDKLVVAGVVAVQAAVAALYGVIIWLQPVAGGEASIFFFDVSAVIAIIAGLLTGKVVMCGKGRQASD